MTQKTVYVVLHRAEGGQGSGYTIAVARNERAVREMVWRYLTNKPGGNTQCDRPDLLEVEELEFNGLFADLYFSLPLQELGIKCEYALTTMDPEEAPSMVAYMPHDKHYLRFGGGGHEREYVLNISGHDINEFIPHILHRKLEALLPNFHVDNRGSRIEIIGKPFGSRDDAAVVAAVKQVFGHNLDTGDLAA
ncbi:MAG: hypothetical protein JSS83_10780 [Cyanobacteria bacterium SZAS LIN-3]|nr:hypothetical protein [Cyanobacteria bacterium SZAS LIN-3]MBS2006054.1 hypothetical protein [Cyanobacteria bacterium SZAS TMP-1]